MLDFFAYVGFVALFIIAYHAITEGLRAFRSRSAAKPKQPKTNFRSAFVGMLNDTPMFVFSNVTEQEAKKLLKHEQLHYEARHPHQPTARMQYWHLREVPHLDAPLEVKEYSFGSVSS